MIRGYRAFHIYDGVKYIDTIVIGAGRFTDTRFRALRAYKAEGMTVHATRRIYW